MSSSVIEDWGSGVSRLLSKLLEMRLPVIFCWVLLIASAASRDYLFRNIFLQRQFYREFEDLPKLELIEAGKG